VKEDKMIRKHKERTKHGKKGKKVNFNISVQTPVSFFVLEVRIIHLTQF